LREGSLPKPERARTSRAKTPWVTLMRSIRGNDMLVSFMVGVEMEMRSTGNEA
jgi:hypothetical protein